MQGFAERLNAALANAGLTQSQLAQDLGISAAAVSGWCKGTKQPKSAHLGRIAEILSVNVDFLMLGVGEMGKDLDAERAAYREDFEWYWRPDPPDGGRTYGDAAGFAFPPGLKSLARECAQNSSDAKLPSEQTAELEFTVIELTGEPLETFKRAIRWEDMKPHLLAAAENVDRAQAAQSILPAIEMIDGGRLQLIRIADTKTTGLTGDEIGVSKFVAVMRNTLDSEKEENATGSFGLGKATMGASSRIGLVLCASNLDEPCDGKRVGRVIGRIGLPWHQIDGEVDGYAGPGWLGKYAPERKTTVSYWENEALAVDLFIDRPESSTGTSFLIVAAYDSSGQATTIEEMATELERGVAESFWPAMVGTPNNPPRLNVHVGAMRNREVILSRYIDPRQHAPTGVEMLSRFYDGETVDEISQMSDVARISVTLAVPAKTTEPNKHLQTEHDPILLVALVDDVEDSSEPINRVTYMRGSRMVVMGKSVPELPVGSLPFHAVVLAGEAGIEDEDAAIAERFLRAAEPPEHNDWKVTPRITNNYDPKAARQSLIDFSRNVNEQIRQIVAKPTEVKPDGPESLRELLRLKAPPPPPGKQPKVKTASGDVQADGSWKIYATVAVPRREDGRVWVFDPVVRFASQSGSAVSVRWRDLRATERCTAISERSVKADPDARTIRIEGETVPDSQPVNAKFSAIQIDITKARGEED